MSVDYTKPGSGIIDGAPTIVRLPKKVRPEDITINDLNHLSNDSFALWTQTSGVRVDNNPIEFNTHRYLLPIYMCNDTEIVWRKAAQLGATVYMLLRVIWWLHVNQGRKAGLYFPTKEGVENLSKDRLTPLLQSVPTLGASIDSNDKLGLRRIGKSSFYLFHLGGVASKDSVPLDFVAFDEVRLCKASDIDQALERISHSPYKEKIFMSTAGQPGADIDARFELGTQHVWRATCFCSDGTDLARTFPDCVVDDRRRGKLYLRCPKCKAVINDPQNGRYVPMNPGADYTSFHVSQLTSKYISLKEIWNFYHRTTNITEFYNAKLGLPFIDEENRGVSMDQLKECVDPQLEWAKPGTAAHTAMGVDVGGGYCYVIIADLSDNKKRIRHLEIIEADNPHYRMNGKRVSPFRRLRELMREYKVQLCVVDAMPNYDMVLEFAQDFPGKVFAAFYAKESKDVVSWSDRPKTKVSLKKAGPLLKFKHYCVLSRFLSMDFALGEWARNNIICPDPKRLVQMCFDEKTKQLQPEAITERLFSMLTRLVKNQHILNEETGESRFQYIYSGGDPHFAHAWNYANIALERMRRQVVWTFG